MPGPLYRQALLSPQSVQLGPDHGGEHEPAQDEDTRRVSACQRHQRCDACATRALLIGAYYIGAIDWACVCVCVRTTLDSRLTLVSHEIVGRLTLAVIARRRKAFVDSCITNIVAG